MDTTPRRRPAPRRRIAPARTAPARTASPAAEFAAVVPKHRAELMAAALRLTRNRADAEDLVQDTMARALSAWPRFEPGSNCRAWLFRILMNGFISGYRRRRRHNRFAHETGEDAVQALYGDGAARGHDPRESLSDGLGDETLGALSELGEDYRAVVEMADLRGTRYRDIAAQLGVPIGTVMSRLFRARRQLEERLREYAASDYGIRRAA